MKRVTIEVLAMEPAVREFRRIHQRGDESTLNAAAEQLVRASDTSRSTRTTATSSGRSATPAPRNGAGSPLPARTLAAVRARFLSPPLAI